MHFQLTEYQSTVEGAIQQMMAPFRQPPANHDSYVYGALLDAELERSGFFEVVNDDELGTVMGALLVVEAAKLPVCAEVAASALVRPAFCPDAPRPLALIDRPARPVRFLPQAKSALIVTEQAIALLVLQDGDVRPVESLLAYPYGLLDVAAMQRARPVAGAPDELLRLWRIGLAAEIVGAIDAALVLTTDYVTQRHQFGRPIGSFQAVQHRLAEVAVLHLAAKWLTFRAASSGRADDAAIACSYAQSAARQAAHDLHQFNGAMGLTLEHPLHLWTYRLKALVSELGGAGAQATDLADLTWGVAA